MTFEKILHSFSLRHLREKLTNLKPRLPKAVLLGCIVGMIGLMISPFRFALNLEENAGLGLLFKIRGAKQAPPDVVVVSIDKESSEELGISDNPDKWPRSVHARLTEKLAREGAEVIAFDVHFIEPRVSEDDNQFAQSIKKAGNVVLCEPLKAKEVPLSDSSAAHAGVHNIVKIVPPFPLVADSAIATAPFVLPRIPFKVNQYWTFQTEAGDSPTMPVVAFQLFTLPLYHDFVRLLGKAAPKHAGELPADIAAAISAKGVKRLIRDIREIFESEPQLAVKMLEEIKPAEPRSHDEKKYRLLKSLIMMYGGVTSRYINYFGPPRTITTIPYHQALQINDGTLGGQRKELKGKAVFVGLSEKLLADRKDSFYTVYSQENGIFVSGVEIMATAFANILEDSPVKPVSLKYFILIILLWGILAGIVCRVPRLKTGALVVVISGTFYLVIAAYQFKVNNVWFPVIVPLFFQTPLAFLGAVGIEHSRLFKETLIKLRMEKDLTFAREVQMSMLPAKCPEVKGYQIAARSTPAREVSGDFFDFIEIGPDRLGFVVADVTGKSVSGALVMTASKSVFRLLSEEELSVGEIMIRANKQTKKDITRAKGMFVALLYAILNTDQKTLSLCSAGQTQPIHLSAETGEATLIETEGDAFPLGILDDADYQETQLQLAPGDTVIFYTDGIVEAMNKSEEMYGFDRFMESIKKSQGLEADSFLDRLIADVSRFVSKAEQHDDLTIIVIKVELDEHFKS